MLIEGDLIPSPLPSDSSIEKRQSSKRSAAVSRISLAFLAADSTLRRRPAVIHPSAQIVGFSVP